MKPTTSSETNDGDVLREQGGKKVPSPQPFSTIISPIQKTILLVDDEPVIRNLGRNILQRQGYLVLLAKDGQEAVDLYKTRFLEIDLVLLDLTMPRLSGQEAFKQLLSIDPNVRVIFSSGYVSEPAFPGAYEAQGFVQKPYRPQDLTIAVRQALEPGRFDR